MNRHFRKRISCLAFQAGIAAAAYLSFCVSPSVKAAAVTVAHYTFTGPSLSSTDSDPGSVAGDIVIGPGLAGKSSYDNSVSNAPALDFESDNVPSTEALAISGSDYVSFTVTPLNGELLDYSSLDFNIINEDSENDYTANISVRWSVDNFATTIGANSDGNTVGHTSLQGADANVAGFPPQRGPVEFRFYFFGDQSNQFDSVGIDSITLTAVATPEIATTLVAAKGDQIGKQVGNRVLNVAGPAAVDGAGDVAVHVISTGSNKTAANNSSILLYSGTKFTDVASAGNVDPITGGTASKLSDPVLSGSGALAFIGTFKTGGPVTAKNSTAVYVLRSGTLSLVARTSGSAPDLGTPAPLFTAFSQVAVDDAGGVAFLGTVNGAGIANKQALFATDGAGNLRLCARVGGSISINGTSEAITGLTAFKPLVNVGGQSRLLCDSGENLALLVKTAKVAGAIVLIQTSGSGFSASVVSNIGDTELPGVKVKTLNEPIVNNLGEVAGYETLSGTAVKAANSSAIDLINNGCTLLVRTGDFAPDVSGTATAAVFTKLSDPVFNNNGRVAFVGTLKTGGTSGVTASSDTGIWSDADGTMKLIAREGQAAPGSAGSAGKFSKFNQIVLPDVGGPIFQASLTGEPATQNQGVWALTATGLLPVIITGQTLDFHGVQKTVKTIGIFQTAPSVIGQSRSFNAATAKLVYQATFTKDLSWGIYEVNIQ